ncbi:MAG: transposase [Chroococcidiopsidaceae cyanobacterium CP_BM_ER_R8_30]|nr:transposase [Chroococcidiopsidaceae cyanobacterium CP_BM_ER_R8_30]
MITLTYEFKLEPTPEQIQAFDQWLEVCRRVWNYALRERKDWFNSRKCEINACSLHHEYIIPSDAPRPTYAQQCKSLTAAKKEYPDLKIPHSQVLQQTLKILETAFVSMWERRFGFPRFKKTGRMRSFVFPQMDSSSLVDNYIDLPKIGKVEMILHRPIPEGFDLKQARIVKRASGYHVMLSLQCDVDVPSTMPHGEPIGIDVGLNAFVATSEGELVQRPRFYVERLRELKLLQRRLKHKKKGSKNWYKLNRRIALLHEQISNIRRDWHFKIAHHLCDQAGMIFAENLNLKGLARGMLSKHILDAAWDQFLGILSWVCWKRDVYFAKVNCYGTSQTCPRCDADAPKDLGVRVHLCPQCQYQTDRDVAAAQVVKKRGILSISTEGQSGNQQNVCGGDIGLGNPMKQKSLIAILGSPRYIA